MHASGTFVVTSFTATDVTPEPPVATALPVGVARMQKTFEGEVSGHASTLFTAAFDQMSGVGTYVAMESFEGSVNGARGSFVFAHSATTTGADYQPGLFVIVPTSGTGELAGIAGGGGISIDADGTHHLWLDYDLA